MKTSSILAVALVLAGVVVAGVLAFRAVGGGAAAPDGPTLTLDLGGAKIELVRIEPGEFMMGSEESEEGHDPSEAPTHKVTIAKPFYIGKFEVTQGQFQAVMNYNQAQMKGEPEQAVDSCGLVEAQKFCQYASERTGRKFRLPTEAEWEYACRAGTQTAFAFGEKLTPEDAVFNWSKAEPPVDKPEHPAKVGSKKANAWGLTDMHGNMWEWCQDVFTEDYSKHTGTQDAVAGNDPEATYVYRGGSWRSSPEECRSAVRFAGNAELRSEVMGFRVVVEPK